MDWFYSLGIFFSIIAMMVGISGLFYFLSQHGLRTVSKNSKSVIKISVVVCTIVILAAFIFFTDIKRWYVVAIGIGCIIVPFIACLFVDIKKELESPTCFNVGSYIISLISILLIPAGRIGMIVSDRAHTEYIIQMSELKVIDYITTETQSEKNYAWVEGSTQELVVPAGTKETVWVVVVTTDGSRFPLCRKVDGVNYEKIYPKGDTVAIYNGKIFHH